MSDEALTQQVLADALHITTRTLYRWGKKPGFPKTPTVESVSAWREQAKPRSRDDFEALKCAKVEQDIEIGDLKLARLRREQISIQAVDALSRLIGQKLSLMLRQKVEVEMPARCLGKSIADLNVECASVADEIRALVNENVADYGRIESDD